MSSSHGENGKNPGKGSLAEMVVVEVAGMPQLLSRRLAAGRDAQRVAIMGWG